MDMRIFQVKSNKALREEFFFFPFFYYFFFFPLSLLREKNNYLGGGGGIVMNKDFKYHISLNQLVPNLETAPLSLSIKADP